MGYKNLYLVFKVMNMYFMNQHFCLFLLASVDFLWSSAPLRQYSGKLPSRTGLLGKGCTPSSSSWDRSRGKCWGRKEAPRAPASSGAFHMYLLCKTAHRLWWWPPQFKSHLFRTYAGARFWHYLSHCCLCLIFSTLVMSGIAREESNITATSYLSVAPVKEDCIIARRDPFIVHVTMDFWH